MTNIWQFPEILWVYQIWRSDLDVSLEEDVRAMWLILPEIELTALIDAIRGGIIAKLPEWFQGRRVWDNTDIIELYTTRQSRRAKTW